MARVTHQVGIVGDIADIYRALHHPQGIDGWWATKTEGTPAVGEVLDLCFRDLATLSFGLEALEENRRVCLKCASGPGPWQGSDLEFTLTQAEDQVWVRLVHENAAATDEDFLYFSTKWACYLLSLRDLIETATGRPYPNDVKIHLGD